LASVIGFSKSNSPPGFYPIIKGPQVYTLRPYLGTLFLSVSSLLSSF
jgi:hypothetical protein